MFGIAFQLCYLVLFCVFYKAYWALLFMIINLRIELIFGETVNNVRYGLSFKHSTRSVVWLVSQSKYYARQAEYKYSVPKHLDITNDY